MKQIKNLQPSWHDLDTDIKSKNLEFRRSKAFEKWLLKNVPDYLSGKYSFSSIGDSCIRVFIELDQNEEATINLLKWLPILKKAGWKIEKFWRKESGYFSYKAERNFSPGYINYIIFFEGTANIDGCVIVKKRKMQTIFTTDCERESILL